MASFNTKISCSKAGQEVFLTLDLIKTATMDKPNQYIVGLISRCSGCNYICKECPAKDLIGQSINL